MADAVQIDPKRLEALGPAERTVQALSSFTDHMVHNRPGFCVPDARANIGVRWAQALWRKQEDGSKVVFTATKQGKKVTEVRVGVLGADGKTVREGGKVVGEYRTPGLFPEVATWLYQQVAAVFKFDNEFAAKWASFAFTQDRRDLKVILAAFMLVQDRRGDLIDGESENPEDYLWDDDYRTVGEAMILTLKKGSDLNPRQLLLVRSVLQLTQVHETNRELGFSKSAKNPAMGRYDRTIHKWLAYREGNQRMLDGLVKAGFSGQVRELAKLTHYKATSASFYQKLRWKQKQTGAGHRTMALGMEVEAAESWEGLTEAQVCERIMEEKPRWKVLVGRLPSGVGLTRAIMAAAVEAGALSNKDLIILTPTLEDLGLLTVEPVASAWKSACLLAEDQRARNIARNVKTAAAVEALDGAADVATAKAIEKVTKNLRVYVIVDKSGSMQGALDSAKRCLTKFLGGFPLDRTHVSVFNTFGSEVVIKTPRSAAVEHAFKGHAAGGGTAYREGVRVLQKYEPQADEDVLFIFVGDDQGESGQSLANVVQASGLRPSAFAFLFISGWGHRGTTTRDAATILGIPYIEIQEALFDDPYAVTNTLTNLIASTPVGQTAVVGRQVQPVRASLAEQILKTPLLPRPTWAL